MLSRSILKALTRLLQLFVHIHGSVRGAVRVAIGLAICSALLVGRYRSFLVDHLAGDGDDVVLDDLLADVFDVCTQVLAFDYCYGDAHESTHASWGLRAPRIASAVALW